jgi:hypothetical protein
MSINLTDQHVRSHKLITLGKQDKPNTYCDAIEDTVNVNDWSVRREVNEYGKIILIARRKFNNNAVSVFDNASIELKIESAEKKALPIKAIKDRLQRSWEGPRFIEVPDGENKMSSSLEKDRFIERHYRDSSILTPSEYFNALIQFNEIIAKIQVNK